MPTFFFPWKPNATLQAPLEAGATKERRLEVVACKRLLGCWGPTREPGLPADRPPPPTRAPPGGPCETAADTATAPGDHTRGAPCPTRPPGRVCPPGVDRALLGHRTDRVSDRDRLPQTTTPTHARTRRPASGIGRRATRAPRTRALGDGDTRPAPGGCVGASTDECLTPTTPLPRSAAATPAPSAGGSAPPHPPMRPGSPTAAWDLGLACCWAWDGLVWRCGPRGHRACDLGRSSLVCFCAGQARKQGCAQQPNARGEPRPAAGATQERRLLGVGSSAMLGPAWVQSLGPACYPHCLGPQHASDLLSWYRCAGAS